MSALTRIDPLLTPLASLVARGISRSGMLRHSSRPLVVRPGGLGDLVVATAALEAIGVPLESVDWLIERRSSPWAVRLGLRHACYDASGLRNIAAFATKRSLVVCLEQRYGLAMVAGRALTARNGTLWGVNTNRASVLTTKSMSYDPWNEHELTAFARVFAEAFGTARPTVEPRRRRIDHSGTVLLALAGSNHPSRTLAVQSWLELLARVPSTELIISCAPADRALAEQIASALERPIHICSDFASACEAIVHAERVVTIDGGMVHVASYYGVPVLAAFTAGRERKWAPWSAGSEVLRRRDLTCQPCTLYGVVPTCNFSFACRNLGASAVRSAVASIDPPHFD